MNAEEDDGELRGLRRVAEEMNEMNNIIANLQEKATTLNKIIRVVEPKLVTLYLPFQKSLYDVNQDVKAATNSPEILE
eukprot:g3848.t1